LGYQAASTTPTKGNNVAVGYQALTACTEVGNTGVGYRALYALTSGTENCAIGDVAGSSITTANFSTFLGSSSGGACTGSHNTFVGRSAGSNLTSGANCVYVGSTALASAATVTSEIVISGNPFTSGKGSNTGFISPNSGAVYQGNNSAAWSVTSDQRLKKNIVDNNVGLDAIKAIQVRNFEYRLPEEVDPELSAGDAIKKSGVQLGVIAQELQQVLPDCVKQESTGVLSVDSDNLTWYTINAIKQLSAALDAANARIAALEAK
jgi:hypothetical protein